VKNKCPTCRKPVKASSKFQPFCSERCRLIDLGDWISGNYRIADKEQVVALPDIDVPKTKH